MNAAAVQKEALRQQMLLRALWADARPGVVAGWLRDAPARATRGLQAYRANAGALAERALAAAYPTVAQLVGDESFAALARALWFAHPPQRGDIGLWGEALAGFIAAAPQLADEPYLADVARLDWALHRAEQAADRTAVRRTAAAGRGRPRAQLRLRLADGMALLRSAHPVVSIWQAHRSAGRGPLCAGAPGLRSGPWRERAGLARRLRGALQRCPRPTRASCRRCWTAARWRRRWTQAGAASPSTAGCCRPCSWAGWPPSGPTLPTGRQGPDAFTDAAMRCICGRVAAGMKPAPPRPRAADA